MPPLANNSARQERFSFCAHSRGNACAEAKVLQRGQVGCQPGLLLVATPVQRRRYCNRWRTSTIAASVAWQRLCRGEGTATDATLSQGGNARAGANMLQPLPGGNKPHHRSGGNACAETNLQPLANGYACAGAKILQRKWIAEKIAHGLDIVICRTA